MMAAGERRLVALDYRVRFEVIVDRDTGEVVRLESRGITPRDQGEGCPVLEDGSYGEGEVFLSYGKAAEGRARAAAGDRAVEAADRFRAMLEAGEEVGA